MNSMTEGLATGCHGGAPWESEKVIILFLSLSLKCFTDSETNQNSSVNVLRLVTGSLTLNVQEL